MQVQSESRSLLHNAAFGADGIAIFFWDFRNANYLLFQKCETFLGRRHVKARDAFDIHLLLSRGAQLDKTLRPHLEDLMAMKELAKESVEARIEAITAKLCTVELRPVLPL